MVSLLSNPQGYKLKGFGTGLTAYNSATRGFTAKYILLKFKKSSGQSGYLI